MYRLVVIDDEYIVVEGIKAMIARKKLEYEVVGCAYDGIHGLEVIRETASKVWWKKMQVHFLNIRIRLWKN